MKKILFLLTVIAGLIVTVAATNKPSDAVVLTSDNSVVLRNVVDDASVAKLESELSTLSQRLPKTAVIYLVLDTPGGSVFAGLQLIEFTKSLPQEVKTLTNFAASMGFITVQGLGERLVLPWGVLMSHRAKGGSEGQTPGELEVRSAFWSRLLLKVDEMSAKRLGLTVEQLRAKHRDEYWTFGQEAVDDHAADRVVMARCDKSLSGTVTDTVMTFLGPVSVNYSKCPLITAPLSVGFGKIKKEANLEQYERLVDYINSMLYNRRDFIDNFILTNKWQEFQK